MKAYIWVVVASIVIIVGAILLFQGTGGSAVRDDVVDMSDVGIDNESGGEASFRTKPASGATESNTNEVVVTYTADGFSPENVTISVGDTVGWVNETDGRMWVASDNHPSHTVYGGTSRSEHCPNEDNSAFDQCESGDEYSFTFTQAGEWAYHDHANASEGGVVVVE